MLTTRRALAITSLTLSTLVVAQAARAEDRAPATDLESAAAAVVAPAPREAAAEGDADDAGEPEPGTTFEAKLRWQSRSLTDYWYRDPDADGDPTSSVEFALEMEHALSDDWRLWAQIDGWFDARDTRWSSSQTDSIALVAALRRDLGAGFELELGARYDDWNDLHATKGDPWGPYAMVSFTVEALGGELSPYVYHELRNYIDGDRHDGTWISEIGADYETPLSDAWTLKLGVLGGRVDGSRSDPDVWALGASAGVAWAWSEDVSIGVSVEATRSTGALVPNRTIGFVAVELIFTF